MQQLPLCKASMRNKNKWWWWIHKGCMQLQTLETQSNFAPKWLLHLALRVFRRQGKKWWLQVKETKCKFKYPLRTLWEVVDALKVETKRLTCPQQKRNRVVSLSPAFNNSRWTSNIKAPLCPINNPYLLPIFNRIYCSISSNRKSCSLQVPLMLLISRPSRKTNWC